MSTTPQDDTHKDIPVESPSDDQGTEPATPVEVDEVTRLTEELAAMKNIAARAQADLVNGRERMKKEKEDFVKFAQQKLIMALLPVLDNLQRAMEYIPEAERSGDLAKGVEAVIQQFLTALVAEGVTPIEVPLHTAYDPNLHEAVLQEDGPTDHILAVLETGYQLHGRVLRPTKVKVGRG